MKVGEKLRVWRKAHEGLTQTEAAKAAGISQSAWAAVEIGDFRRIGLDVAQRIVEVTSGAIAITDFPRPRGRRVRPVPSPSSGPELIEDTSLHARQAG